MLKRKFFYWLTSSNFLYIIVLLILAAVSIATLTGQNGILTRANDAKEQTEIASLVEQVQVDILGELANKNGSGISAGALQTILKKYFTEESIPEDANSITAETVLTATEEYGGYDIPLSDIYNGEIIAEREPIEVAESYIANFADMDGDGTADGIIYADLAVGGSGMWSNNDWSNYSYEAETGLKEYYIKEENYTEPKFGNVSGKLIAPMEGTTGADRFYVMALENINPGTTRYCWYDAAYGKLDKIVESSYNDFGDGDENTAYVMAKWDLGTATGGWGVQNDNATYDDIWGAIKEQVNEGWFVPSKSEWSAFGDMLFSKIGVNTSNYNDYGLNGWYWSSSQYNAFNAYLTGFGTGHINLDNVNGNSNYCVRLSATF